VPKACSPAVLSQVRRCDDADRIKGGGTVLGGPQLVGVKNIYMLRTTETGKKIWALAAAEQRQK